MYKHIRKDMFDNIKMQFVEFPTLDKVSQFQYLMKHKWREVSKFINSAWQTRKTQLYTPA